MTFSSVLNILLVAFAFGFVIFWHELGHFLAARWAGVRVEQFAVGMGHAIVSWRKGLGARFGNTQNEFDRRVDAEIAKRQANLPPAEQDREWTLRERYDVAEDLGMGETEYRLSWIPLGGYVKPTGQDDLRPAKEVGRDDPKAFGAKPVGKRMVIISAGVVMNVILAFFLYVVLFLYGFNAPPTIVGQVVPGSPAQTAGLLPGDRILSINGREQQDYTKLRMNIALLRTDEPADFVIDRPGVGQKTVAVTPAKNEAEYGMAAVGVAAANTLDAVDVQADDEIISPETAALPKGSRIVRVNGQDVSTEKDSRVLVAAVNAAAGGPVPVVVKHTDGSEHPFDVRGTVMRRFNADLTADTRSVAGMLPRVRIVGLPPKSPAAAAGLKPGDVIKQVATVGANDAVESPTFEQFLKRTSAAGEAGSRLKLAVRRDGGDVSIEVDPTYKIDNKHRGIGVSPDIDLGDAVVAGVLPNSAVAAAGVAAGDRVTAVNGAAVATWLDVINALRKVSTSPVELSLAGDPGERKVTVSFNDDDRAVFASMQFTPVLPLAPLIEPRRTTNPLIAARWGWDETRSKIFEVYVTLRRVVEGQVPLSNLSGPVGIFNAGTTIASKGFDWLIWFTALISANLAVVNFLPIPIVDGGLFTFLVAEKITGKPASPRVQTAAQIAGILLLGSLFLFVTYHDILRKWG